ncbi:tRNA (N6-isopentenyl adenosine(37)-C2)-methylthiotransferase MiaB [Acetohalobium arabaticum]|uniref:tRNA-2-methylthio-N(6)-dimethylallyladenosine synthase n=1 Tax=Acetohalobium arabaticum (strain ATCC 49924 / DSM 5501 / Z-7288) TaxID=574087 RepID=D9QQ85_ACEAZ|nr:tRNA (N6-isopentenyl adenosine(37)-C2)-methylthiotransferase MiaB [Acetohalobium arabaticum]ADL12676.1 tRNA-i(6)A37 thiotransferase enzyme MiaB [Acetohalobium arabaticum DSM 5501]
MNEEEKKEEDIEGLAVIETYGCQMNEHDSEKLAGVLKEKGYKLIEDTEKADVIILNTCCIRENAEVKVHGKIGYLKQYKRENPDLIIGICGCMMQQEGMAEKIKDKHPHVDIVFGTHNIHEFSQLLDAAEEESETIIDIWGEKEELIPDLPTRRETDHKAWVTIIYGCNNFCTYCIVPYVRGREKSRSSIDIVDEIKELADDGVKEVTLLGQNVNSYGYDLDRKIDFADLLEELDQIEGIERIRYMTSHPRDFTTKLIKTIADSNKVCEHFHLPIQSGSSRILEKMNRGYTQEEYLALVEEIRSYIPQAAITTDFIVGFPGERDEDFAETLKLVEEVEFDMAYTFKYSQRSGTPAAEMEGQIEEDVKQKRLQKLMDIQSDISAQKNKKLLGKTVKVLGDGESKNNPERQTGRTRTNKIVVFNSDKDLTGKLINVKINKASSWTLTGDLVK